LEKRIDPTIGEIKPPFDERGIDENAGSVVKHKRSRTIKIALWIPFIFATVYAALLSASFFYGSELSTGDFPKWVVALPLFLPIGVLASMIGALFSVIAIFRGSPLLGVIAIICNIIIFIAGFIFMNALSGNNLT